MGVRTRALDIAINAKRQVADAASSYWTPAMLLLMLPAPSG
jgi:hypothetical protein